MSYSKKEIGKYVTLKQGFAINKNTKHHMSETPTDLHLLRIGDMKDNIFNTFVKDTIPKSFLASKDDIIYTRTGQVGLVFTNQTGVVHNNCFTVTPIDENILSRKYLFYALQEKSFYAEANARSAGAAQPDLPHEAFKSISLYMPPLATQKKIADILSAYDDLIENNQKQIKLLEEVAQRLYKEWFVDLHFPNYENTEIVDGIPSGWKNGKVGDVAVFKRGKTITKSQVKDGNVPVVAGGLEPSCYHNDSNTKAPVITVSGSGANAGYTRLYHVDVFASDCSFADSETTPFCSYIYNFLKANKAAIDILQKGSAQPHVYAKDINAMEMIVPTEDVLSAFCNITNVYYSKIGTLDKLIKLAQEARDRLLPKLMSGEIEV